ncbi:MAG: hypothetical protein QM773_21380 [Hyphomonadaceae bacterium]
MRQERKIHRPTRIPATDDEKAFSERQSLVAQVRMWVAEKNATDVLVDRWQKLEHHLSLRAKASDAPFEKVLKGASREAKELRSLTRQIAAFDEKSRRGAEAILQRPSRSQAEALAKIQLAVRMQTEFHEDLPWALVRSGLRALALCQSAKSQNYGQ